MQATTRRRPLGDIGNTLSNHLVAVKERPKPCELQTTRPRSLSTSLVSSPRVDDKHKHNPLHTVDYLKDIYDHFRKTECNYRPSTNYMARIQSDITEKMRGVLVDWLVDVHLKFKLLPETLFLCVEIIDRFLDKKVVNRQKLQLVGCVAMLLAGKYEEIYPPEVKDFIYISANTYVRDDMLRMERLIFQTLDFNLTIPTIFVFLKRGLQVVEADSKSGNLAQFLAELALGDYCMLKYLPSMLAASCIYLSNKYLGKEPWSRILEHYTTYKATDLEHCLNDLQQLVRNSPNQKTQAVRKKYSYTKYGEVTKMTQVDVQLP